MTCSLPENLPSYAQSVLSALGVVASERDGWVAHCPCPGHGQDRNPSLRVTVGEEGRLLVLCRVGCPTREVLQAVGLSYQDLFPGASDTPLEALTQEPVELSEADVELRNEVYTALLGELGLSAEDHAALTARGLDDAAIATEDYRTLPEQMPRSVLSRLRKQFADTLFSVPGFAPRGQSVAWTSKLHGILIPCRNEQGQITALKVRRHAVAEGEPRYVYLSGRAEGLSSGAHVHFPIQGPAVHDDYLRMTEGEIKATVAGFYTHRITLGLPGVSQWRRALPLLPAIPSAAQEVRLAFDWPDVKKNYAVFSALRDCVSDLRGLGFNVTVETWDGFPEKGIDDLLHAGHTPTVLAGDDLDRVLAALASAHASGTTHPAAGVPAGTSAEPCAFPCDVFPGAVADFIRAVAAAKQCPEDFPGVAALVVAASMIGSSRSLRIKGSWQEKPCIYSMIVADAGSRKSPALKCVMDPVYALQTAAIAQHLAEHPTSEVVLQKHYYVNDITVESLAEVLSKNPRGVLCFRDEAAALVRSHDQYRGGKGTDRQFWLSCWSSEPLKVDRKGKNPLHIPHPLLGFLGGIQPSMLSELEDRKGREDGFLHRILFSFPRGQAWLGWSEASVDDHLAQAWYETVERLSCLEPTPAAHAQGVLEAPITILMDEPAKAEWVAWFDSHEAQMRGPDFDRKLIGHYSKLEAYSARFALTLRMLHTGFPDSHEPVCKDDILGAIALVDYFKSHAQLTYAQLKTTPEDDPALQLLALAQSRADGLVTVRMAMRGLRLSTRTEALAVMKRAADRGLGELLKVKQPATGRYSDTFSTRATED